MARWNIGKKNGMWKGGRSRASSGYILIRVGADHHLADTRGYAYEHRLVAEKKIGRRLRPGELVHHIDGNKENNDPENLDVMKSRADHRREHRKSDSCLRIPGQPNPLVSCACGCGRKLSRYDSFSRPRRYISGHNLQRIVPTRPPQPSGLKESFGG